MASTHGLSRRGFCLCCIGATTMAATGGWLSPRQSFAKAQGIVDMIRADAARASIKTHKLRGNVAILEGSGGNIAVLTGSDGKLLVDAGITATRPRIVEALSSLNNAPVKHLINTHWHFDHADGNEWVNGEGATILAHDNTRKNLLAAVRVEDWDFNFPAAPSSAIPTETFSDETIVTLKETKAILKHHPNAHTDGDITVTFAEANVLHAGDIYWNGIYPFIDYSTGGSIDGTIRAVEAILATTDGQAIIIPGHGYPVSNRSELRDYHEMLVAIRDRISKLKSQNQTLEEIIAANPTAPFDQKWGRFVITPAFFTKLVYEGV
ncbi:MBL fold metallo-hydrolase [Bradyrhizobium frederickii]|uniref:MBL fold metallo-hydrolase n=1 Tax=Bradyrhizobium frederickii TaxID=2560054 RepID=A0A4Y9LAH4_9BRAD|nr:MBL fold metallo-hydrolase [Bradyrhizobium frederickii]TFV40580.1 MBL fold metallo-hydrolase [Bradyrhizobium frederickii]